MIVVIGLLAQIAAVVAVAGVATNSGSTQPLSGSFVIFGLRRGTTAGACSRDRLTRSPAGQCTGRPRVDTAGSVDSASTCGRHRSAHAA
jgi:hypothetical protein